MVSVSSVMRGVRGCKSRLPRAAVRSLSYENPCLQSMSAYVRIRQQYDSIRQHTLAYVSIRPEQM
jgi:hypothetical protein